MANATLVLRSIVAVMTKYICRLRVIPPFVHTLSRLLAGFLKRFVYLLRVLSRLLAGFLKNFVYLLRALGLELVNVLLRNWNTPEVAKTVLRKSFWISLSRCSTHVLPVTVECVLLFVNYYHDYFGGGFGAAFDDSSYLAMYQVSAKIQEILCVASLSTIILQLLRNELVGDGLPIGLIGSGLWFNQVNFFWSPDFLMAAPFVWKRWRRIFFYLVLVFAGGVATVIGPATAILMLPRFQEFPAGGTRYFLNGTADQFWPMNLTSDSEPDFCRSSNASRYSVCPSGGYESLRSSFGEAQFNTFPDEIVHGYGPFLRPAGASLRQFLFAVLIQGPQAQKMPTVLSTFQSRRPDSHTFALQPHMATAIVQQRLIQDWYQIADQVPYPGTALPSFNRFRYANQVVASGRTTSAATQLRCTGAQNISAADELVNFPYYISDSDDDAEWSHEPRVINITALDRNQTLQIRTQWISLRPDFGADRNGASPVGILVEFPWANGSRMAFGCTAYTGWADGPIFSDTMSSSGAWSNGIFEERNPDYTDTNADGSLRLVTLDVSWLELLTPSTDEDSGDIRPRKLNTLEKILVDLDMPGYIELLRSQQQNGGTGEYVMTDGDCVKGQALSNATDTDLWNNAFCNSPAGYQGYFLEILLAVMINDGVSRHGSSQAVYVHPEPQTWDVTTIPFVDTQEHYGVLLGKDVVELPDDPNIVVQRVDFSVVGWAYYASSPTDYLATAVACAYILLAITHVAWIVTFRVTSSCWDTITELLLLCQNSAPSPVLRNTSAGIQRLKTYTTVAKLRSVFPEVGSVEQKLQLIFESCPSGNSQATNIQPAALVQDPQAEAPADGLDLVVTPVANESVTSKPVQSAHGPAVVESVHSISGMVSMIEIDKKYC